AIYRQLLGVTDRSQADRGSMKPKRAAELSPDDRSGSRLRKPSPPFRAWCRQLCDLAARGRRCLRQSSALYDCCRCGCAYNQCAGDSGYSDFSHIASPPDLSLRVAPSRARRDSAVTTSTTNAALKSTPQVGRCSNVLEAMLTHGAACGG